MIKLYDSAFSPLHAKVTWCSKDKGSELTETVDGLLRSNHDALKAVNGRIEVPALGGRRHRGREFTRHRRLFGASLSGRCRFIPRRRPRAFMRAPGSGLSDTFVDPIFGRCLVLEMGRAAGTRCRKACWKRRAPTFASVL